jgi:hypothetical protein
MYVGPPAKNFLSNSGQQICKQTWQGPAVLIFFFIIRSRTPVKHTRRSKQEAFGDFGPTNNNQAQRICTNGFAACNRVFGWRAAGAEQSRSAPAAVWMGSGWSGAAPGGIYSQDAGRLRLLNFEGRSGSAPVSPLRLLPVSLPSLLSLARVLLDAAMELASSHP